MMFHTWRNSISSRKPSMRRTRRNKFIKVHIGRWSILSSIKCIWNVYNHINPGAFCLLFFAQSCVRLTSQCLEKSCTRFYVKPAGRRGQRGGGECVCTIERKHILCGSRLGYRESCRELLRTAYNAYCNDVSVNCKVLSNCSKNSKTVTKKLTE